MDVVLDNDAPSETLMTASYTFMDETLAQHYGVFGIVVEVGGGVGNVELPIANVMVR